MRAGLLRHRVKIEQASNANDRFGDPIETWTNWPTGSSNGFRWAQVVPRGGSENSLGGAHEFVAGFTVTMRFRSGLSAGMRLTHNGRILHIESVENPDEIGEWMIAECEEVT